MFNIMGAAGLAFIVSAYVNLFLSPGASFERYVNNIAYGLLIFPTAFVLGRFFSSKKIVAALAIALFTVTLVSGLSSPDWHHLKISTSEL